MAKQSQQDIKSAYLVDLYQHLEDEIIKLIVKRLNTKDLESLQSDEVLNWYFQKLNELGSLDWETVQKLVNQTSKLSKKQLASLIKEDGYKIVSDENRRLANLMNRAEKPWSDLDQILNQLFDSTWLDIENYVNQTLLSTNFEDNGVAKAYTDILNKTLARVTTGLETPQNAFKRAVKELVQSGIKTGLKDKGGHDWSLERYVRMVVDSTNHHVNNDLRLSRMAEYHCYTAYMSTKAAAREACAPIQGHIVLMFPVNQVPAELRHLPSVFDYGWREPSGCGGIHCHHRWTPCLPDMDISKYPKPPSEKEAIKNAEIVAKQRRLETSIRQAKKMRNASELVGTAEEVAHFDELIRNRQAALRQFIRDNDKLLHRDYSREQVYS